MTLPRVFVAAAAVALLLAGCAPASAPIGAPTVSAAPTPSATPQPTETASSELPEPSATPVPVPASIVVSFDALTIRDAAGVELASAPFTDSDAVLAMLSYLHGWTPDPVEAPVDGFGVEYRWGDVSFLMYHPYLGTGTVYISSPSLGGYPVSTPHGIHIGSTRADVLALDPFTRSEDPNNDLFGLDPHELPGTESYWYPGLAATSFIFVQTSEGEVRWIQSPSSDESGVM